MAPTRKILIVDDSATSRMWQTLILRNDYAVSTASDGQEGVDAAIADRPDLILMDVLMPRMNGFEAVRALRAHKATRDVPVIMVTTRSEAQSVEEGYTSGCNDYITKPIDKIEMLVKISSYLSR